MATIHEFEDLEVWKKARVVQKEVFELTKGPKFSKDYGLVNQINDATDSTMGNISEGIERDGHKELMQFLSIAKGSAGEVRSHLWVAYDREYIDEQIFNRPHGLCKEISKMIGGFMRYLRNSDKREENTRKQNDAISFGRVPGVTDVFLLETRYSGLEIDIVFTRDSRRATRD